MSTPRRGRTFDAARKRTPPPVPTFFGALYPDRAPLPLRPSIGFGSLDPLPILPAAIPLAIDWPSLITASRRDVTLEHAVPGDVTIRTRGQVIPPIEQGP